MVHLRKKLPSQITLEKRYYIELSIDILQHLKFEKAEFIIHVQINTKRSSKMWNYCAMKTRGTVLLPYVFKT